MSPIPANVVCAVPLTNAQALALSGWTIETRIVARYMKLIANSTTAPNTNGGSDTHVHPSVQHGHTNPIHDHTWPTTTTTNQSPSLTDGKGCLTFDTNGVDCSSHAHSTSASGTLTNTQNDGPANWDPATSVVPCLVVIFVKSNGTATGFPASAIVYTDSPAPVGWAIADGTGGTHNAVGKMLRGAASGADGGIAAGTDPHSHTMIHAHAQAPHGHPVTVNPHTSPNAGIRNTTNPIANTDVNPHDHGGSTNATALATPADTDSATGSTTTGSIIPLWHKLLPIQNVSGNFSARKRMIGFWLEPLNQIPANWHLCDGADGTPNACVDRYIMGAANVGEFGTQGGDVNHGHNGLGHFHGNTNTSHGTTHTLTTQESGLVGTGTPPTGCGLNYHEQGHRHNWPTSPGNATIPSGDAATATVTSVNNDPSFVTVAPIMLMVDDSNMFLSND